MATGEEEKVGYSLVSVGTLTLEKTTDKDPWYISIVVCQDKIGVLDFHTDKVKIHGLHDGKLIASSDRLESVPRDMCLMDAMTICVIHKDGLIKMMSIDSTDMSRDIKTTRTLCLQGVLLDRYHGVVRFKDSLVVTGVKQGMMYWCIVSLHDGHVDTIHQICIGDRLCRVTTKDNIIYISCWAGVTDTGVYGFDIFNPSQCKYKYKHQRLQIPTSIVINEDGNIFVCNPFPDFCIHQLTASCQLVAIFTQGIPFLLRALFWDNGHLYGTCYDSHNIIVFRPVYQGSLKASAVLVSDERKHPVNEETAIQIGQGNVNKGQSSVETEMPPSVPFPGDSEDKQDPVIPSEILNMDSKSLEMYKQALSDGKEKVYNIRVMVVGQFGVGKTTLTKRLLGRDVTISDRKSTEGIDIHIDCCKVTLATGEWMTQEKNAEQYLRLQRLVKLLNKHAQKQEANGGQEGQSRKGVLSSNKEPESKPRDRASVSPTIDEPVQIKVSIEESCFPSPRHLNRRDIPKKDKRRVDNVGQKTVTLSTSLVVSDKSEKKDAVIEIIKLVNKNTNKLQKNIEEYAALGMWDFAGQYVFYTTHQTFLTNRAIYILVIDLSQELTDHIQDDECFLDTEGIKKCKVHDLVEIWLNSIHSCSPSTNSGIPPVILVGTHMDKIPEESRQNVIQEYFKKIRHILKDKPVILHLTDDIAIDNTIPDPKLEELKKRIFELASKQPHWGEEKPARWLPLEQAIMTLKASGVKVVPLSLVEEINSSGSVRIGDGDQLELFLRFHHEIGTILYFSVEGLREKVVLDPQWMIDALKSLITAEMFIIDNPTINSKWLEFKEKGKLKQELIDAIWTKEMNKEFHDHQDHILLLMEKLNIITKTKSYSEDGQEVKVEEFYLAPCMLRQKTPRELISPGPHSHMGRSSVLCFAFVEKFLPPPVFHRLIAACLACWPIAMETLEPLIYCGCCIFKIDQCHQLTLYVRNYTVFACVSREERNQPSTTLCVRVREFVAEKLTKIIGYYCHNLNFQYCLKCPMSDGDCLESLIPVSELNESKRICPFHRDHEITSSELKGFWFQKLEQSRLVTRNGSQSDAYITADILYAPLFLEMRFWPTNAYDFVEDRWQDNIVSSLPLDVQDKKPSERQLGRLSMKIGQKFLELTLELGLSWALIEQTQRDYRFTVTQCLMLLVAWLRLSRDKATFRNLEKAFRLVSIDVDILDSIDISGNRVSSSCLPQKMLDKQPKQEHLIQICRKIGKEYMHLGVELGVSVSKIEQILIEHPQNVQRQCFEIVTLWKNKQCRRATFRNLEQAFRHVGIDPSILKLSV